MSTANKELKKLIESQPEDSFEEEIIPELGYRYQAEAREVRILLSAIIE